MVKVFGKAPTNKISLSRQKQSAPLSLNIEKVKLQTISQLRARAHCLCRCEQQEPNEETLQSMTVTTTKKTHQQWPMRLAVT
jgi:hypothetical protein